MGTKGSVVCAKEVGQRSGSRWLRARTSSVQDVPAYAGDLDLLQRAATYFREIDQSTGAVGAPGLAPKMAGALEHR